MNESGEYAIIVLWEMGKPDHLCFSFFITSVEALPVGGAFYVGGKEGKRYALQESQKRRQKEKALLTRGFYLKVNQTG